MKYTSYSKNKKKIEQTFNKLRNNLLLKLGFTLRNYHGHTVRLVDGEQIKSNRKRFKDYSMDDKSWRVAYWRAI
jgi:hypothetical protein